MNTQKRVNIAIPSNPIEISLPPAVAEAAELFLSNPNQWLSIVRLREEGIISEQYVVDALKAEGAIIDEKKMPSVSSTGRPTYIRHFRYRRWV